MAIVSRKKGFIRGGGACIGRAGLVNERERADRQTDRQTDRCVHA